MSRRLDPPHDRVDLSSKELATLQQLERGFASNHAATRREDPDATLRRAASRRSRVLARSLWISRAGPALIVLGLVVLFAALPWSVAASGLGAALALLGVAMMLRPRVHRWRAHGFRWADRG